MNQLDALVVIRENVDLERLRLTRIGSSALAVLDRKIAQLRRKNARRGCVPSKIQPPPSIIPCWSERQAKRDQFRN